MINIDAIRKFRSSIEAVPLNEVELHPVDEVDERGLICVREKALITIEKARASRHIAAPTEGSHIPDDML